MDHDNLPDRVNLTAQSQTELLSFLRKIDISVPGDLYERKTVHVERWSICRFLSTMSNKYFSFPLKVEHTDRPDFTITELSHNCRSFGVEFTEATPEDYKKAQVIRNKEFPDALIDMSHFKWGMPRKSVKEIRVILSQDRLTGSGWAGDSPEREWAQAMQETAGFKTKKLNKLGFRKLDENWLLIYDNLPLPHPDINMALEYLTPLVRDYKERNKGKVFDKIIIESGNELICEERKNFSKL